jgi:mannosyltransferase
MAGTPSPRRSYLVAFALVVVGGIALRLDQLGSQLLLEDEWHAVYRVLHDTPLGILLDFGHSDSSIPLTLLYSFEASVFGLSELAMRWPAILAGIATLALFPWYAARRIGSAEALSFAALLAISPLLFFFSRMARPYALTLLLVYAAHVAFRRYMEGARARRAYALAYAATGALAGWLHLVIVPFVLAPFVPAAWGWMRATALERRDRSMRLTALAIAAGIPLAALLLPPLLAHPESLSLKSGTDLPRPDTWVGLWYHWFGTGSTVVAALCGALAVLGTPVVWRRIPEARSMVAGVALCLIAVVLTRPAWIGNSLTLARYLLPVLPLLLLATACGGVRIARALAAMAAARPVAANGIVAAAAALPVVALAATTPLAPVLAWPNANSQHLLYQFDFRPAHNPLIEHMARIPLSPWWATLATRPPASLKVAVAPFPVATSAWDAPRWQRVSRQSVLSAFLTGVCATTRPNDVPDDARFAFRNSVHLDDVAALSAHQVDYVVWQKPYRYSAPGVDVTVAADVAPCGDVFRQRFGSPAYEDDWLVVYAVPVNASDARRHNG